MRFPTLTTSIADTVDYGYYAVCAVEADDEVAGLEAGMAAEDKMFRGKIGARNVAKDALTRARAKQAVPRRRLATWYLQLERDAKAAYGGNTQASGYHKLLPQTAPRVLRLPLAERFAIIATAVTELSDSTQPIALHAALKPGEALVAALTVADVNVAKTQKSLDNAMVKLQDARTPWLAAYKSLAAALTQKFPLDKERVESYFLQPVVVRVKKAATVVTG